LCNKLVFGFIDVPALPSKQLLSTGLAPIQPTVIYHLEPPPTHAWEAKQTSMLN
jgi:hypothetical protein